MQITKDLKAAILALPKIELHIHLEGCISLATLQFLAKKNRITIPRHLAEKENIQFNNFEEFVATFYAICNSIREEEDFTFIAHDLIDYIRQNNIIYCEVSWTPFLYLQRGFNFSKVMAILNDEIARHNLSSSIYFIIDTQRDHGTTAGELVFDKVLETKDANIKGIGLTGQEQGYSASAYKALYRKMRDHGYGCTAHAGEYGAALDVWQCLLDLEVKRIGHGIRAISDPALLEYIKQNDIHLEVSPTSNVRLNRVESYALHPVKKMIELGLSVGINSDDPGIFNTGLTDEYINLLSIFNFERDTLKQCNTNAAQACFAPVDTKEKLLLEIRQKWK